MFVFTGVDNSSKKKKASKTLGISSDATMVEIKKAYRKAALKWHPDKNIENKKNAEEKFKEVTKAYQILTDKNVEDVENDIGDDIVNRVFEDFIYSMNGQGQMSEEDELNLEAEELFHILNNIPMGFPPNNLRHPPPEVFVFGPQSFHQPHHNHHHVHQPKREKKTENPLTYRVRIKISDIWKNLEKKLNVKRKYYLTLPLYYDNITFESSQKHDLPNINVEIVDKDISMPSHQTFKRKNEWDLEMIKSVPLNDLYKDFIMDIELPDKTVKKVRWKKEFIDNIKDEKIKGFFLYNLGLPTPDKTRGKLWVRLAIILPSNIKTPLPDNDNKTDNNVETNIKEFLTPEWVEFKEWQNNTVIERSIVLELDKYLN